MTYYLSLLVSCCMLLNVSALSADPYFIFIVGGSASGKTTLAKSLVEKFGYTQALYISLDEYLDKRVQPKEDFIDDIPNFDNPSMIHWAFLLENIALLQNGLPIPSPIYDFALWMPKGFRQLEWRPVIIIEGIHATQKELDLVPGLRIFIDVNQDKRYQRRVIRDAKERNYPLELINKTFFQMAVPSQKQFLDPTLHKVHLIINNLEGKDYLEKASRYIVELHKTFKTTGFEKMKLKIQYEHGHLTEKSLNE